MHVNAPFCPTCQTILNRYPNPHPYIVEWVNKFRHAHVDAHISACGRGREEQEADFAKGASRAHFGESAHNYNAAVDIFRITQAGGASFDAPWFRSVLGNLGDANLTWGGTFHSIHDLPHVEWAKWKDDANSGVLTLVS